MLNQYQYLLAMLSSTILLAQLPCAALAQPPKTQSSPELLSSIHRHPNFNLSLALQNLTKEREAITSQKAPVTAEISMSFAGKDAMLNSDLVWPESADPNVIESENFGDRISLEFNTSFTGEDRLITRLRTGCLPSSFNPTVETDNFETDNADTIAQFTVATDFIALDDAAVTSENPFEGADDAQTTPQPGVAGESNFALASMLNSLRAYAIQALLEN